MSAAALAPILQRHPILSGVLQRFEAVGLPDAWLVAGAVAQAVWNDRTGRPPAHGLKDIDIVYFDPADLSAEAESAHEARLRGLFADLPAKLDVKNEARVHLWYRDVFGQTVEPYRSTADAIATFPAIATSVGARPAGSTL
ncbi:MAG TPA: nucleotidyltransferase family protein, partial [Vineibacter sp.]|nr:nucleotidyltransferase family protein [Vineibacter sp.]